MALYSHIIDMLSLLETEAMVAAVEGHPGERTSYVGDAQGKVVREASQFKILQMNGRYPVEYMYIYMFIVYII